MIFLGVGFILGFISAYMILKINELELKNKILEKEILDRRNNKDIILNKKEEKKDEEKEELIEEKIEEKNEVKEEEKIVEEKEQNEDNKIIVEENIEENKPKKPAFVPHEIKERKVQEEEWTTIKKGKKKKKP